MNDFKKQLDLVLYHSDEGDISVNAYIKDETLWITQKSMAELFDVDKSSISRHLKNIFESGELNEKVAVAKFATTTQHGAIVKKWKKRCQRSSGIRFRINRCEFLSDIVTKQEHLLRFYKPTASPVRYGIRDNRCISCLLRHDPSIFEAVFHHQQAKLLLF